LEETEDLIPYTENTHSVAVWLIKATTIVVIPDISPVGWIKDMLVRADMAASKSASLRT
jgi:hypothetical protein